jgi:signal transduction histidine kinase
VGRWGLLALLASACLVLGRVLLPSGRLVAGLSGLVFGLSTPIPMHPGAAVEDNEGVGWPEQEPSDDEAADLLRLLSGPIERLTSAEAIVAHALGWTRKALTSPWAAIVLRQGASPAAVHGLGEYPDDLERLVSAETEGAAASDGRVGAAGGVRVVPLVAGGTTVGALALPALEPAAEVWPWRRERLVEAAAPLIAAAVRGADLVRQREELSAVVTERELSVLSEQVVRAQEEVRRRISLDLHDEPLQRAILLHRAIRDSAAHPCAARWLADVDAIATSIRAICNGLRPRVLDDFGLVAGLEWLVDDVRSRSDLTVFLTTASAESLSSDRLSADLELALFRVAQEALNNCLKHARATQVHVTLWREGSSVRLTVTDDGERRPDRPRPSERRGHLGIAGMGERLRPWGGVVTVRAGSDCGTVVAAEVSAEDGVGRDE